MMLETETVSMTKIYLGQHSVSYSGHADENGIWGTWSLTWRTGGFHLWPKSLEEENYQEEKEQVPIGWVQEVEII